MCGTCDYKSYIRINVVRHFSQKHPEEECEVKVIKCQECDSNYMSHEHDYKVIRVEKKTEGVNNGNKIADQMGGIGSKNLVCNECGFGQFQSLKDRLKHYKAEHPGKTVFSCNYCKYGANYLPNLNSHVNSQHQKKEMQCKMCSFKTTSNVLYPKHMKSEHGYFQRKSKYNARGNGQTYLCQECGYSTFSQDEFNKHENLIACSLVQSTGRKGRGNNRIGTYSTSGEIKKYKCNKCSYSTDYPSNVREHVKSVHESQVEISNKIEHGHGEGLKFICRKCDFEALKADHLKEHLSTLKH